MSNPTEHLPERLSVVGATDLERRLLGAASQEEPDPELSRRMAAAIGISTAAAGAAVGTATVLGPATTGAKAAAGATALPLWIYAGVLVFGVAGVMVGTRVWMSTATSPAASPAAAPRVVPAPPPAATPAAPPAVVAVPAEAEPLAPEPTPATRRHVAGIKPGDLRDQIAMVDAARAAVKAGAGDHALEILRRYHDRYPTGSFRPEAAALRIEALAKLGRTAEAQSLAERFIAEHGSSPLADRVARVAGLPRR
jgi:hypothetical protein